MIIEAVGSQLDDPQAFVRIVNLAFHENELESGAFKFHQGKASFSSVGNRNLPQQQSSSSNKICAASLINSSSANKSNKHVNQ